MIEKGSKIDCIHCGEIAFITKEDIPHHAPLKSMYVKTPISDCKILDKIVCYKCRKPLNILISSRWYK